MKITAAPARKALEKARRSFWFHTLAIALALAISVFLIWSLRMLILPMVIGVLLAYIFRPMLNAFRVHWLPNSLRITLILSLLMGFLILCTVQIRESIPDEFRQLGLMVRMQYKLNERYDKVMEIDKTTGKGNVLYTFMGAELNPLLKNLNKLLTLDDEQKKFFLTGIKETLMFEDPMRAKTLLDYYNANQARLKRSPSSIEEAEAALGAATAEGTGSNHALAELLHTFSIWLVTPLVFLFLLFDKGQILRYIVRMVPNRYFEMSLTLVAEVDQAIGKYLRGTLLECFLVGITMVIGLFLIGFHWEAAVLIGLIAGLTNAIPFVGPLIGLIIGVAYALIAENISPLIPWMTPDHVFVGVVILVAVAHLLDNAIYAPVVLGSAVNLHPLAVILGVIGGSLIFGFAGILLAIPTIVVFKVTAETLFRELKAYDLI